MAEGRLLAADLAESHVELARHACISDIPEIAKRNLARAREYIIIGQGIVENPPFALCHLHPEAKEAVQHARQNYDSLVGMCKTKGIEMGPEFYLH